ncbi:MAG TPA: type II toxin-antitoxin system HicB family antitoxin [Thermodesulfobacteriota bacterium]|nr:type II toxin-antitoxin system HicB family antitoxin [Thermodesulfobacteriota bacterium]
MPKHFPVIIESDQGGVFIVECPTIKGCRTYGHTVDEAMVNIREAIEACLEFDQDDTPETTFIGIREDDTASRFCSVLKNCETVREEDS